MSLLNRKRTILAKIETTYGTDPVPTGGANAILVKNMNITPMETTLVQRDVIMPYLGGQQQIAAAVYAKVDFEVEMAASGTAGTAPAWGPLMRACGMSETVVAVTSVTYAPVSAAFDSVTLYLNVDGVLHKMTGARGTVSASMSLSAVPMLKFSFTGIYQPVVDAAAPTVVLTAWKLPLAVNNTNTTGLTLQGFATAVMSDLSVDIANAVTYRSLVGGVQQVLITDRHPVGSITIEAGTVAAKDWFTAAQTAATGPLSITHGITAGNKVKIDGLLTQVTKPTYSDKDGIAMLQMGMNFIPTSGNDELTFTCL